MARDSNFVLARRDAVMRPAPVAPLARSTASRRGSAVLRATRSCSGRTLLERVDAGNPRYLELFALRRGVMRALAEAAYVNPRIAQLQSQLRGAYLRRLRDPLARQAAAGHCQAIDVDAPTLALGMMVEGAAQAWVVTGLEPFERPLELARVCRQITDI